MFFDKILYDYAMSMVGTPYIWGGDDQIKGFDCSGLIIELMRSVGEIPLGRDTTAQGLLRMFDRAIEKPTFGALLFWGSDQGSIRHVAFAIDENRFIGAQGGGRHVKSIEDAIKHNAYIKLLHNSLVSPPVAIRMPDYKGVKNGEREEG